MLTILDEKINSEEKEKSDLINKLEKSKTQSILDNQKIEKLEHNLTQVEEKLQKSNDIELSNKADLKSKEKQCDSFAEEIETLKLELIEKDNQIQAREVQNEKLKKCYETKVLTLEEQFQIEKQKFNEER